MKIGTGTTNQIFLVNKNLPQQNLYVNAGKSADIYIKQTFRQADSEVP